MSEPIGVGDFVECVRGAGVVIPLGSIHRVAAIRVSAGFRCISLDGRVLHPPGTCCGIRLATAPDPENGRFYNGCSFRPIRRSQHIEQLISTLRQPAPELGREVETAGSTGRRT